MPQTDPQQSSSASRTGPLRTLLPAEGSSQPLPAPPKRNITQRRLDPVLAACEPCRKCKVKCSGGRPACHRCLQRKLVCIYVTRPGETRSQALNRCSQETCEGSSQPSSVYEELIGLLKNLPDQDAQAILQRLRSGTDAASVLSQARAGDVLLQMAAVPETAIAIQVPLQIGDAQRISTPQSLTDLNAG
ncbi:nitrogen assimilation transcription factor nit-4 [Fusarium phyllophilum]|uniref:Nitrogen assimilation transcription factor nit-4 n=1 Tax=Fusarium phyllophilum TaxID=47803 RepID=A0A8H5JZC9_9HYPO|nr:nitrogen assimilation transcription factor nit-4 [Fusarium phyllophilum]